MEYPGPRSSRDLEVSFGKAMASTLASRIFFAVSRKCPKELLLRCCRGGVCHELQKVVLSRSHATVEGPSSVSGLKHKEPYVSPKVRLCY